MKLTMFALSFTAITLYHILPVILEQWAMVQATLNSIYP